MFAAVDVQGFTGKNGEFVFKELAIGEEGQEEIHTFLLKPPYPFTDLPAYRRKSVHYLRKKLHGLEWSDGHIPYEAGLELVRKTLKRGVTYYCKGEEKAKWLTETFDVSVLNIEKYFGEWDEKLTPAYFDMTREQCAYHSNYHDKCAKKQVQGLRVRIKTFFHPQPRDLLSSKFDMRVLDSRIETFQLASSTIATSAIAHYLARQGYYYRSGALVCNYCGVASLDWQQEGKIEPKSVPHFHEVCSRKQ